MKRIKVKSHGEVVKRLLQDPRFAKGYEKELEKLKIVDSLIRLREKQGMTQAQLAKRIGVTQPFIAKIESGESRNFSLETLIKLAIAMGSELEVRFRPHIA